MILPHNNLYLPKQHLESLPQTHQEWKYYNGQKYETPKTFLGRFYDKFSIQQKLENLRQFYPYQKVIKATVAEYQYDQNAYLQNSLIFTGVTWFAIYSFARQGKVLPVLRQYGMFFKTHRIFRQYLWTLVLPILYQKNQLANKYYTHVETLQNIHVNRLNQHLLEDPIYTFYPAELQAPKNNLRLDPMYKEDISRFQ
ncbi:hypothetical protein IMG5_100110 [Ichthyophthirius multifiliis]|uniref:Uncharacterized protein n=1 Tax=Ichthyophthirius multifiliis TaxID=5932 RepID=G0QSB5_ICHMU|nr:hypothetical protein IMG5_100110 [Ichthyophthirius multifiliis]EGR31862.1 hypothetical protein IMG5_100110 [Ichthyophthirius multifiliis]|eukprot:XP_004035348.1 hypothetical protein IMG5_100110 [Ichthyophthirius multifiliis]